MLCIDFNNHLFLKITSEFQPQNNKTMSNKILSIILVWIGCSIYFPVHSQSPEKNCQISELDKAIKWKFETKGKIYASPVVSDETLYVGSLDSVFYAIDKQTGTKTWSIKVDAPIMSTAVVHSEVVYFESGNKLYAINTNGTKKWEKDLYAGTITSQIDPWDFHHSSPVIYDNNIYICTEKGFVFGFDLNTGKQNFKIQTENSETIRSTPLIKDNVIYFGDWDGVFYAYNTQSKKKIWHYDTKNDTTYRWKNSIIGSSVIYNGNIIFCGKHNRVYSFDAKTGNKNWVLVSPTHQWYVGGLVLVDNTLYVGSSDQHLFHAIDASKGTIIWQTKLDARIWGKAAVHEGKIFIGSNSFFTLDKNNGKIINKIDFPLVNKPKQYGKYVDYRANIHSSPIIDDNTIFFGSDDKSIYAVEVK